MRCRQCQGLLQLRELPVGTGEAEGLRVEVFGLRGLVCDRAGHPPEPPYPDFPADLVARATRGETFAKPGRRGLWRRRPACPGCGAAASDRAGAPDVLRARVRMPGVAPFTLSVEGSVVTCGRCGLRQLEPAPDGDSRRLEAALERALLRALAGAGLAGLEGGGGAPGPL